MDTDIVAFGVAVVGFITWLSRLESKGGSNERDIARLEKSSIAEAAKIEARFEMIEKKHYELDNRVMDKLSNIERLVAKIEGQLSKE